MFGYITPCKPEMKVKEFESYRAVYCGLCQQLKADYGFSARMLLNYDLVLVALIADSLAGEMGAVRCSRCIASPAVKRHMLNSTGGLRLAAASLVLLGWYKLRDDVQDEKGLRALLARGGCMALGRAFRRACKAQPALAAELANQAERQRLVEQMEMTGLDAAAEPSGLMTAAVFGTCAPDEASRPVLERMGLFLGKIIYWLDAAEDYEKDVQKGRYNVFVQKGMSQSQAVAAAKEQCRMAGGEIARCYNLLPWQHSRPILDNIIFLGLTQSVERAGQAPAKNKSR